MKTNFISVIATVLAMAAATAAYGVDYYVDANNGNDAWDGTTAAIPDPATIEAGGTIPGPRKTLHAMMSDARVVAGDVVNAAEGDYNEGGTAYNPAAATQTVNRVQVKAGVKLLATGARDATFITGSGGTGDAAYTNGAARCVYFLEPPTGASYGCGIVKGFTLRNGRTAPNSKNNDSTAYAGGSWGNGLLVECDLVNNGCKEGNRAGTIHTGTALRCRFSSNDRSYVAYQGTKIIDSLIVVDGTFYSACKLYNCTFSGNGNLRNSTSYNCFYIGTGAAGSNQMVPGGSGSKHYNTFSRSAFHATACVTNETCRVVTEAESPYDGSTFRPLAGSVVIDAGDMSYYAAATNGWPAAWLAECGKDYYGKDRVVHGTIDVGCGETQSGSALTISDSSDGLVVVGAEKGESHLAEGTSVDVTFSRNFTSDQLCLGVEVDGVFHSFGGTTSDVPYAVTIPATHGHDFTIAAVYETDQKDWYVSPTGNDTNKGYHKNCPRKTLVEAMKLATANAGHVVHAAAGIYDSGEAWAGSCSNRVVVTKGVGLVADEWPLRETVIKGAADTTADADSNGNGPAAVRCAYVSSGGYVRGFKLTGGRTDKGDKEGALGGGAYLSSGALIDCEVTGVGSAYRGPAVTGGTIIRCYVHGIVCGSYHVLSCAAVVDSYLENCYSCSLVLNSTVANQVRANATTRIFNTYLRDAYRISENDKFVWCTNCVFSRPIETALTGNGIVKYDPETCLFEVPVSNNVDTSNRRPKTSASPLVDAGNKEIYNNWFPAAWVQFKGQDFACGQRIYNAQIDVGCGEYDFRGDFAGYLGTKVSIPAMGPNVTTNAARNIVVPEGETIDLAMPPKASGKSATYELVYTPEGGEQTVVHEASANGFSRTLEGACTVQSLSRVGFVFLIR